ncbi:Uu.00g122520.m01.CDS01 [Anthostomella pinea]|uniref:Uu.00g122520.m01.CDS01 n=1 Tax=Anthostomella pinea TaxID=933095 RepID=A0AAI8YF04_9PEZI|nr:Uu.00g122520.m01.CDS01 [Anthostomella pinea]
MSTGAIAVVLAQTPNRFDGLQTIGKIFFILDLILFALFNAMMATRFILVPAKLTASLHHPVEGLFFGAYWVSVSLILNCMQAYGVPHTGPWLVKAIEVLYWMYVGTVLLVAVFQYYTFFQEERLAVENALPAWIFPIYPLLVIGPMAGTFIPSQPQSAAYPMWVSAVMLQGLAWTVALMMYTIYTLRLMSSVLPPPPTRPGMYVSVGPAGYTAAGLISLGTRAPNILPPHVFNMSSSLPDGDIVKVMGIMSGTFIILFALWFFFISTVAVISGSKRMTFTLNWWAFVFPNAGLTLAAIQVGKAFNNSAGINGICSALTIMLVIMWLFTAVFHIKALWEGKLLWPGKDEDKDMKFHRGDRRVHTGRTGFSWGRHGT